MLGRVAAWWIAVFLVVSPAASGIEPNTLAAANAPAVATAIATPHNAAAPRDQTPDSPVALPEAQPDPEDQAADIAPAPSNLAALDPAPPTVTAPPAAEPFGLAAVGIASGDVLTKWSTVKARIAAENKILAHCHDDVQQCPAAAQNFLAIVALGRAQSGRIRVGVINRAINLAIEPMSDLAQWGVPDRWSPPLETFTTGRGDCEDYAIAKYVALTAAGVPAEDVKLVIVRNTAAREDHAVVAVRLDGDWIVLDNRWLTMLADREMSQVVPLFVLDGGGVRKFTPPVLTSARQSPAPASL
ncbi:MAG TPA: transglutaminase-like cysteine peptidase [Pirellulales bacterium]|jgi:predicted transglutaminase-like cysteine proteinase|nr:transglutaminase-like cysteine peptidase [Pirellulales bacterium]